MSSLFRKGKCICIKDLIKIPPEPEADLPILDKYKLHEMYNYYRWYNDDCQDNIYQIFSHNENYYWFLDEYKFSEFFTEISKFREERINKILL